MEREEKLETVVKLFSKAMFYGDWQWETPNERSMEMLMRELGYWPYKDEDDMISKSPVDEELYQRAIKTIPTRYAAGQGDQDKVEQSEEVGVIKEIPVETDVYGYCVKCKVKKVMSKPNRIIMKNKRQAIKGICPDCGTGMFKILGKL